MANRGESRITPDVARNYNLTPAASAVDKQLKYNPQLEDAARLKHTADGLVKLAKGLSDVDALMQRQARDNALQEYATKTGDETKKKWADVSHNIKGMAKFNPYNEDAYNALVCNDIGKKYINDLYADPELKYRSPEEVDAMINNLQNDMIAELGSKGFAQRYYAKSLLDFKQHSDNLVLKHTSAHAEVKMQRTDNQISTTYSNVLLEGGEAEFTNTLDTVVLEGKGLGRSLEGNANNVINTVQKAILSEPSKFNSAFVLGQLKTYKVDGKPLTEIVPNLEGQVLKMVREAKNADLNDRKLEYETKQFDMQLKREEIATDFINQLNSGKLFTAQELQNWAVQMSEQAGLDGVNSIKLFHDLHTGQKTFMDLKQITSDPEVVLKLQQGIFTGETTALSLAEAMGNGTLGVEDAQKLGTQITEFKTKKQTQEIKRIDEHIKRTTEEYTKNDDKTGRSAVLKTRAAKQELLNRMQILRGQYEEGKITYEQFNDKLAAVKSACREIERQNSAGQKTGMLAGYESLMSTPAISQEQWNRVDVARSTLAIRRMGIIKNSLNQDSKTVYIDSEPQAHRESTGTRHTGYDLGGRDVQIGKAVHCPVAGQVVGVLKGDNGGMGNMVLVRAKNGKLIKFMHLQYAGLPSLGSEISEDTVIGHVGNTGNVKNSSAGSLHFECYDENMQWITAWEFVQ